MIAATRHAFVPRALAALALLTPFADAVAASSSPAPSPASVTVEEVAARRARLARELGAEIAAGRLEPGPLVVPGAPEIETVAFEQADHALYLTGIREPGLCLVLHARSVEAPHDEVLFLADPAPGLFRWVGPRLAAGEGAPESTGFSRVESASQFRSVVAPWLTDAAVIYYLDEGRLEPGMTEARLRGWLARLPGGRELDLIAVGRLVDDHRRLKSAAEVDLLRRAATITTRALLEVLPEVRPGRFEYQIEGALAGRFRALGADGPAYPSIVGSGPNSCVLHYTANRRRMEAGELCLIDVGARFGGYSADVTRTVPVSGRFSPRQRQAYDLVLAAQDAAIDAVRPGATFGTLHAAATRVLRDGLPRLLGREETLSRADRRRYFPHATSHWIGIAVHDVGRGPLEPGVTFTVEPGLYLAEEGLGIRIEDDFFMREDGTVERLSIGAPRTADEIERLMLGASPFPTDHSDDEGR